MARLVLRRLLLAIPTLLGITLVTFALLRLLPGDPASLRFEGEGASPAAVDAAVLERFRAEHLLDAPLWQRYFHYLGPFDLSERGHAWFGGAGERPFGGLLVGDLGRELLRPSVSIAQELGQRLWITVPLSLAAALLIYALALPLGVALALRRGSNFERVVNTLLFALYATPTFWLALALQATLGGGGLGWAPVVGLHGREADPSRAFEYALDALAHSALPIASIVAPSLAYVARHVRSSVQNVLEADFVLAARARGASEREVIWRHVVPNALAPVVTLAGQTLPWLVGGWVVIETVFELPGMGKYAYDGLMRREYDVVAACVLLSALLTAAGHLASDLAQAWIDPRLRLG